jgi:RHS repeat-associated protein
MQWQMVQDGVEWFGETASGPVTVTENLGNVTFIHTDGLGSPVARTDGNGNLVSRTRYEPYGYVASGATPTLGFTGHVNDADTGLTYMQQRYYDPVAGRFLSIDPVTTDTNTGSSFNRYAYANNSPYKYIDPDGRDAIAVAFPDYKIQTPLGKMGGLGHAGVLFVDNKTGATKYYEYGRYNKGEGAVRTVAVPNVKIGNDGTPTSASLNKTLDAISAKSGQGGPIQAAYVAGADPVKMEAYAQQQLKAANDGTTSYSLLGNNCATFMKDTIEAGGIAMPSMVDPRPNSYISEVQNEFPKIDLVK